MKKLIIALALFVSNTALAEENWQIGAERLHHVLTAANNQAEMCLLYWGHPTLKHTACNSWLAQMQAYTLTRELVCGSDSYKQQVCFYNLFTDQQRQIHLAKVEQLLQRSEQIKALYQAQ